MGASYLSRRIGNSPRNPRLFACGFFSANRVPGRPRATSDPRPGLVSQPSTHPLARGAFGEKKVEFQKDGDSKTRRNSQGSCKQARYRESGLGQRVVPRLYVRPTRGREKLGKLGKTWDCERRLTDLAVNFPGRHTRARPKGGQHAAAGTVRSGDSERSSRERGGHPARCAVPGASEASAASRGAAPSTRESAVGFSQSSDVAGRRATMASSSPADVHVLLVDDDRVCRTLVAGMLKKCNYQGEPRDSPRARASQRASTRRTT